MIRTAVIGAAVIPRLAALGACGITLAGCLHPTPPAGDPTLPVPPATSSAGADRAAALASDRGCFATVSAQGSAANDSGGGNLIIRAVQATDPSFQLTDFRAALDGVPVFNFSDQAGINDTEKRIVVSAGPGPHTFAVAYTLAGQGQGAFAYLRGYRFHLKSSHAFRVEPGWPSCVSVLLYFDNSFAEMGYRPRVTYREERGPGGPPSPPEGATPPPM